MPPMRNGAWLSIPFTAAALAACTPVTVGPPPAGPRPPPRGDQAAVPPPGDPATPPPSGPSHPDTVGPASTGPTSLGQAVVPTTPVFQAVTSTAWTKLPLPTGVTPRVVAVGPLADGWYLAGNHTVGSENRRWVVRVAATGKATGADAGPGTLTAAADAMRDLLLAGTDAAGKPWFGRFTADNRFAHEATFKADVAGSELDAVVPLPDGALLAGVHNPVKSGETNGWLVALDAAGKVRWELRHGSGAYHFFSHAALARSGHLLAVGAKKATTYQGWMVSVDKDGKLAGESKLESRTWDMLRGIVVAGDEELYVTGKASVHQDGDGTAFLARRRNLTTEAWRHSILAGVVMVGAPILHRNTVELLVATGRGDAGNLHLVRASRDGTAPTTHPVSAEPFSIDWLMMPGWITHTTDASTTIVEVRRSADGGLEWRTTRVARK